MRLPIIALALALSACERAPELRADDGWVRLPAVAGRPGAAYVTIHGGDQPATLLKVTTPSAIRAELHESGGGAMATMRAVTQIDVPAGSSVALAPGGKHVMLFDVDPKLKAGDTAKLSLDFADGKTLDVAAKVVAPGEAAPHD